LCAEAIGKTLNQENLFELIILAYKYNCDKLKKSVSDFLLANSTKGYFKQLIATQEWKEFAVEHSELAKEILAGVLGTTY
jgi:hypothetical protein